MGQGVSHSGGGRPLAAASGSRTCARQGRVGLWFVVGVSVWLAALPAPAQWLRNITLAWDAQPEVAGYKVYYGTASRKYTNSVAAGSCPWVTISNLWPGVTYYFAVTACAIPGVESDYSAEISYTIPYPPPKLCLKVSVTNSLLLTGTGQAGHRYELLATRRFTGWQALGTATAGPSGTFTFVVPKLQSDTSRFFRGRDLTGNSAGALPTLRAQLLPDRRLLLTLTGQTGHRYDVEASTDGGPWKPVGAVLLATEDAGSCLLPVESQYQVRLFRLRDTTYSASQWPASLSLSLSASHRPLVAGVGTVGCTYELLASEDLAHWKAMAAVTTPATGTFHFTDTRPATNAFRAYRLRQVDP